MESQMTPPQAIQILDTATLPANAGKLNRADYAAINAALTVLAGFVAAHAPKPDADPVPPETKAPAKRGPKPKADQPPA
jgi:hypothetical protein